MSSKPYVGIIVPNKLYKLIPNMPADEKCMFSLFEEAGQRNNVRICYFTLSRIKANKSTIRACVKKGNRFILKRIPRPKVVYSRILDHSSKIRTQINSLVEDGVTIFNRPNYDVEKFTIHQLLARNSFLEQHLPYSCLFSLQSLRTMMNKFDSLILKTNYGERGMGAMKLDKVGRGWCLSYKAQDDLEVTREFFTTSLPRVLQSRVQKKSYMIQETIPLATHKGNPFDMRVSVQKNHKGYFIVTGIICKIAKKNDFLTNGSQGSTTCRLENIYSRTNITIPLTKLKENIQTFSLMIANNLDQNFPHLADLGFDIGVNKDGIPYFIECNFISDYVGGIIVNGKLLTEEWSSIFTTPIDYAKFLLDKRNN